jgi:hypothetical protein
LTVRGCTVLDVKPTRHIVAAALTVLGLACLPATAVADVQSCTADSAKIGFKQWGPAVCATTVTCSFSGGCAAYPYITVRSYFWNGQTGSVRGRGEFVPVSENTILLSPNAQPQLIACTAPKQADSPSGLCIGYGTRFIVAEYEQISVLCHAPVGVLGLPVLLPKDVSASVSCSVATYPY